MSQYTDKAMDRGKAIALARKELAVRIGVFINSGELEKAYNLMKPAIEQFQHIEAGEPDCRTCEFFDCDASMTEPKCLRSIRCINFSQYKHADDFEQLTFFEVTK